MESLSVLLFCLFSSSRWVCGSYPVIQDGVVFDCQYCPAGSRVQRDCTKDINTTCVSCEDETFLDQPSGLSSCFPCRKCGDSAREVTPCERIRNRVCICENNTFQLDDLCIQHTKCPRGYGVQTKGNATRNVRCHRCLSGYFSDEVSNTAPCKKHQNCFLKGFHTKVSGNNKLDVICDESRPFLTYKAGQHPTLTTQMKRESFYSKPMKTMDNGGHSSPGGTTECFRCFTVESLVAIIISMLLAGSGWYMFIKEKRKLKKCRYDMRSVDKDWKCSVKGTGEKQNALHEIAKRIGSDWPKLLGELGCTKDWRTVREENRTVYNQALEALRLWTQWEKNATLDKLKKAVQAIDRNDIYESLDKLVKEQEIKKIKGREWKIRKTNTNKNGRITKVHRNKYATTGT